MVADLRLTQELRDLEAKLEGNIPNNPVEIVGTSLPIRKRVAPSQLTGPQLKMPRFGKPKGFSGASLEELTEHADWWRTQWDHPEWIPFDWEYRVLIAASSLSGYALQIWSIRTATPTTQEAYLEFQRNVIRAPTNRIANVIRRIQRFRARDN